MWPEKEKGVVGWGKIKDETASIVWHLREKQEKGKKKKKSITLWLTMINSGVSRGGR